MRDIVERIETKIDKLDEKLHSIDITLVKQEASLDKHIKRTDINEAQLQKFEKEIVPVLNSIKAVKIIFSILTFIISAFLLGIHFWL
jgi:hypothetical protein